MKTAFNQKFPFSKTNGHEALKATPSKLALAVLSVIFFSGGAVSLAQAGVVANGNGVVVDGNVNYPTGVI